MTKTPYRKLTPQKRRFVDLLIRRTNGTDAIRIIRPALKRPDVLAAKWKAEPDVQAAIAEREEQAMEDAGITNTQILLGLARIADLSAKDFVHADGKPKSVHELDDDVARCVQSIEVDTIAGLTVRTKFKAPSKIEARKLLGQYKKLFTQKLEHAGPGGAPLAPPNIGITFSDGGPGTAPDATPEGDGVETS